VADLIERIGREIDMYRRFALEPTLLEVSPEAHVALTRLLRRKAGVPDDAVPASFRIGDREIPYRINPKDDRRAGIQAPHEVGDHAAGGRDSSGVRQP